MLRFLKVDRISYPLYVYVEDLGVAERGCIRCSGSESSLAASGRQSEIGSVPFALHHQTSTIYHHLRDFIESPDHTYRRCAIFSPSEHWESSNEMPRVSFELFAYSPGFSALSATRASTELSKPWRPLVGIRINQSTLHCHSGPICGTVSCPLRRLLSFRKKN